MFRGHVGIILRSLMCVSGQKKIWGMNVEFVSVRGVPRTSAVALPPKPTVVFNFYVRLVPSKCLSGVLAKAIVPM